MPQLSLRLHVQLPSVPAAKDPVGIAGPLATLAQWTPAPNSNNSRSAFALAVATAFKAKNNASHFVLTTKQSFPEVIQAYNDFGGAYDGFYYADGGTVYVNNPSLHPLLPVLGVKGAQTGFGGDSAGAFAEYLWRKSKAGHAQNAYVGEAEFAKSSMAYTHQYAQNDVPLEAFFIDMTQQNAIISLFNGGLANWVNPHGDIVLPDFAALGIKLIVRVPPCNTVTPAIKSFIDKMNQHLGGMVSWAAAYPAASSQRDAFAAACGGPFIDWFNVTTTGSLTHADGTGSEPALTIPIFKATVLNNPLYGDRHVMIECGGDSLLVLNQLP